MKDIGITFLSVIVVSSQLILLGYSAWYLRGIFRIDYRKTKRDTSTTVVVIYGLAVASAATLLFLSWTYPQNVLSLYDLIVSAKEGNPGIAVSLGAVSTAVLVQTRRFHNSGQHIYGFVSMMVLCLLLLQSIGGSLTSPAILAASLGKSIAMSVSLAWALEKGKKARLAKTNGRKAVAHKGNGVAKKIFQLKKVGAVR